MEVKKIKKKLEKFTEFAVIGDVIKSCNHMRATYAQTFAVIFA